jgi:hypothetical protein
VPFTLNLGLQGLLELVGGLLLALVTRTVAFVFAGCLPATQRTEFVHSFVFLYFWVAGISGSPGGERSLDRIRKPAFTSAASPSPA